MQQLQIQAKKSGAAIVDNLLDSIKDGTAFRDRTASPQVARKPTTPSITSKVDLKHSEEDTVADASKGAAINMFEKLKARQAKAQVSWSWDYLIE